MYKIFPIICLLCLLSCSDDSFPLTESSLVVEGWIENDGYPVVMITKTLPINGDVQNINNLEDYLVRWARVSVINNEDTVILTGKYDKGYLPPYIYTTTRIKGKVGENYQLVVECGDKRATATTTILPPPIIDSYKVEKCIESDTLYQIKACMTNNRQTTQYYQFFSRVGSNNKQFLAAFLGNLDSSVSDQSIEFPVYRGLENQVLKEYDTFSPYFSVNDSVAIKCCQLDYVGYSFWKMYVESRYLSGAAMLSTTNNLPSNIVGGTGYWFGYGATTSYFVIAEYAR